MLGGRLLRLVLPSTLTFKPRWRLGLWRLSQIRFVWKGNNLVQSQLAANLVLAAILTMTVHLDNWVEVAKLSSLLPLQLPSPLRENSFPWGQTFLVWESPFTYFNFYILRWLLDERLDLLLRPLSQKTWLFVDFWVEIELVVLLLREPQHFFLLCQGV